MESKQVVSVQLTSEEEQERYYLMRLQSDRSRFLSQEEFNRLQELNQKMFTAAGSPHEPIPDSIEQERIEQGQKWAKYHKLTDKEHQDYKSLLRKQAKGGIDLTVEEFDKLRAISNKIHRTAEFNEDPRPAEEIFKDFWVKLNSGTALLKTSKIEPAPTKEDDFRMLEWVMEALKNGVAVDWVIGRIDTYLTNTSNK